MSHEVTSLICVLHTIRPGGIRYHIARAKHMIFLDQTRRLLLYLSFQSVRGARGAQEGILSLVISQHHQTLHQQVKNEDTLSNMKEE